MKRYFLLIGIWLFFFAGCTTSKQEKQEFRIVTEYEELTNLLQNLNSETVILDLRDNRDYENAHCIGSVNVPLDDDGSWLLKCMEENNWKEKKVYLMCASGRRSADAFNLLVENGYSGLVYISFGYEEYIKAKGYENSEGADVCDCYQQ